MLTMRNKKKFAICIAGILSIASAESLLADEQKPKIPLQIDSKKEQFINDIVNQKVTKQFLPMDEDEALRIKKILLEREKQLNAPALTPEILYRTVSIDSSSPYQDQTIYLSPNYISTLLVFDKMGTPWPIDKYVLGLSDEVSNDNIRTNTLVLSSKKNNYGKTNLVISLKDLNTPIILSVEITPNKVDYKTEIRLNSFGPDSQTTVFKNDNNDLSYMGKFSKEELYSMLEGISPSNGKYIKRPTSLDGVEAWVNGKTLYVRTKDILISPSLLPSDYSKMQSADGTYLYTVPNISVLVLSRNGQPVQVKVE